jgi:eIF4-gamma/eIF5/eIF2-epsilon
VQSKSAPANTAAGSQALLNKLTMSHLLAAWRCNNQLQVEVVRAVEQHALRRPQQSGAKETPLAGVFRFVLQLLYDMEVVGDEGMTEWIAQRRTGPANCPELSLFNAPATVAFVQWLEAAESEEEESDSDADDSDED